MNTRTAKALGVAMAIAAISASVPVATLAYADPPEPPPAPEVKDPEGPACDAFKTANPNWKNFVNQPVGAVLAAIPDLSTFNSAISGQLNPAVNIVPVLDNGPYVVFAPTNEAFAKLPPGELDSLRTNTQALFDLDYYHAFLGFLLPESVDGQRTTQQGAEILVKGDGDDITVNDTAKVVCGGIQSKNAVIYMIDTVLNVANAPAPVGRGTTSTSTSTTTSTTTETPTTTSAAPTTSDAPTTTETPAPTPSN